MQNLKTFSKEVSKLRDSMLGEIRGFFTDNPGIRNRCQRKRS